MTLSLLRSARASGGSPGALVVGADVGVRRIKLAGLAEADGRAELRWAVDVPTPAGVFLSEGHFDSVAAGRVLAELLAGAPVPGPVPGAVVLPSAALRVRRLQSAVSDPAALARILAEDSELRVPGVSVEGLHHAVCTLGSTPPAGAGDAGGALVVAAARRDAIRAYAAAGSAGGIRPARLCAPAVALAVLHAALHPEEAAGAVLLLHVGSTRSELVVVHGGAPLLALPVVQGTDHLLGRVRAGAGGEASDSEALLRDPDASAQEVIEEWAARLRGAHRTAVGAAERHLGHGLEALPVRLSGGIARYPAVVERLAAAVPAPVAVLEPGSRFSAGGDVFGPALVLALGAALEARAALATGDGAAGGALPVTLDLAIPEERSAGAAGWEAAAALLRDAGVWAAVLVTLVLAVGVPAALQGRLRTMEAGLQRDRQAYAREAEQVAADSARVSALQADSARLAGTLGTLASLEAARYAWPRLMHAAASGLPRYAWLEGVEMEPAPAGTPSRFRISGVAPAQTEVSRYERTLGGLVGEGRVDLEGSESLQAGPFALVGFRLLGTYGDAAAPPDQPRPGGAGYHAGPPTAAPSPGTP